GYQPASQRGLRQTVRLGVKPLGYARGLRNQSYMDDADNMPKGRVETLADGVFALAMTLLAVNLQPPSPLDCPNNHDLKPVIIAMLPHFRTYVPSFVVIGIYWISHHLQFDYIRRADRTLLWINILFLMFVATLPFSTAVLGRYEGYQASIVLYSAN